MVNVDSLVDKIDILTYVSQFVELELNAGEYFGLCPFHNEKTPSFSVNQSKNFFYCFGCGAGGSVIDFVMAYKKVNFPDAIEILSEYVGGDVTQLTTLDVLGKTYKKFIPLVSQKDVILPPKLRSNVMEKFFKEPIKEWIDEGIQQEVLDKYDVRYDHEGNRIVFPIWDNDGNIISICGRTLDADYKEKKLRKYTYYSGIGTTYFFYGYWQNRKDIENANEILIFEGAKSVFKAEGFGYPNAVASLTDALSKKQIEFLVSVEARDVVICWDCGVSLHQVRSKIKPLLNFKNCYVVVNKGNYLMEKDSPVDVGKTTWEHLYKERVRIL